MARMRFVQPDKPITDKKNSREYYLRESKAKKLFYISLIINIIQAGVMGYVLYGKYFQ